MKFLETLSEYSNESIEMEKKLDESEIVVNPEEEIIEKPEITEKQKIIEEPKESETPVITGKPEEIATKEELEILQELETSGEPVIIDGVKVLIESEEVSEG